METIIKYFLKDRHRAGQLARAALFSGMWLFVASALGSALMKAFSAPMEQAGKIAPATLGEMFPDVPLFWVPEGPVGYVAASFLLLAGIWLATLANRLSSID